ncbi:hypothetical protein DIZ27_15370 [Streptomyces sp. NWU339]|uniref:hypothetical protein n=1 Tax=Streptomyces sp. NWU339 TaxID=2185284 RepID=UPI000D68132A|nr:hypothetical protein [Streptomyces sp. NWU339]PWI09883.1 hypothetical protein DIZ27_15370 [Streptomyces sp. NWU339]
MDAIGRSETGFAIADREHEVAHLRRRGITAHENGLLKGGRRALAEVASAAELLRPARSED